VGATKNFYVSTNPKERDGNAMENSLKYALTNPNLEEPKGDFLKPEDSETPAMDDESTANFVTMFSNLCKFANLEPKDALSLLSAQDWGDDLSSLGNRFRAGF
jgi:hypothetical protein